MLLHTEIFKTFGEMQDAFRLEGQGRLHVGGGTWAKCEVQVAFGQRELQSRQNTQKEIGGIREMWTESQKEGRIWFDDSRIKRVGDVSWACTMENIWFSGDWTNLTWKEMNSHWQVSKINRHEQSSGRGWHGKLREGDHERWLQRVQSSWGGQKGTKE